VTGRAARLDRAATSPAGWPPGERPRERLLRVGPGALSDAELLAVCLGTGDGRHDVVTFARALLERFGGLRPLLLAQPRQLAAVPGLGPARVALLKAVLAVGERHAEAGIADRPLLTDTRAVRRYLQHKLSGYEREVFAGLFLDTRHRLIGFEALFLGSVDRASVHPREVLKRALALNAAAVILAHNHPSGVPEPSPSDLRLTEELRLLLMQVDVRVIDHVVVGHGCTVSLAERGLL
jgi:DNA repair protein RadC